MKTNQYDEPLIVQLCPICGDPTILAKIDQRAVSRISVVVTVHNECQRGHIWTVQWHEPFTKV